MNENKTKMLKVEDVRSFGFMTFVRTKKDGTTFYSFATTADMVDPLPEKVAKCVEESGQKWLDVRFVRKNRDACYKAIKMEDKAKYTIDNPTKVWIGKNIRGYLTFIVECSLENIHKHEKEAKKDDAKVDTDDLPF